MIDFPSFMNFRAGGAVRRFHCWPMIGEQTIAAHSWSVAMILTYITSPTANMIVAALYHDLGEVATGDTPSTAKRASPTLKAELDRLEERYMAAHGGVVPLDAGEAKMLKIADMIDMLLFVLDQRMLGNRNFDVVFNRVLGWLMAAQGDMPPNAVDLVANLKRAFYDLAANGISLPPHNSESIK